MDDMSDFVKQFSNLIENTEIPDNLKEIINNTNNFKKESSSNNTDSPSNNIDIDTIIKIQSIINNLNSNNDPRSNLLRSLKPYLKNNKQSQIDQYLQFLNMAKIFDIFNDTGGKNK